MRNNIIKGTFLLGAAGIITRIIGFYYRIFLAGTIGAKGMGLYQMVFPVYGICICLAVSGLTLAVSNLTAAWDAVNNRKNMYGVLFSGGILCFLLSLAAALALYFSSGYLASELLGDASLSVLLKYLAIALPIGSIHSIICAFFMGIRRPEALTISQLTEQLARVGGVWLIFKFLPSGISAASAMFGIVIGEIAATLLCLLFLLPEKDFLRFPKNFKNITSSLWRLSFPVTLCRTIAAVLVFAESFLIPASLKKYGFSNSYALETLGILNGMALPFIIFPTSITANLSLLLTPAISAAKAKNNPALIKKLTQITILGSFFIGFVFTGIFLAFGKTIGLFFFGNETAGSYITVLAWLCPFLYVSGIATGILNGLGKTRDTFFIGAVSSLSRLVFILYVVPNIGVKGILLGLLVSNLVAAGVGLLCIKGGEDFTGG